MRWSQGSVPEGRRAGRTAEAASTVRRDARTDSALQACCRECASLAQPALDASACRAPRRAGGCHRRRTRSPRAVAWACLPSCSTALQ